MPGEGVARDGTSSPFLVNPASPRAGSLDGMTASRPPSERFFRHVPEMRSQYGSLYPASYCRLKEAYDLKAQIDEQDKLHQAYFNQFNAGLVDESSLDRQVGGATSTEDVVGVRSQDRNDSRVEQEMRELDKKIEDAEGELTALQRQIPANQAEIAKKQKELDDLKQQKREKEQAGRTEAGEQRQADIAKAHTDLSARANAADSFASWQIKMQNLQVRAGKRNIVNTYVWDGDGGFHAEEQQFASTVEHSIGGSFDFGFGIGGEGPFCVSGGAVGLTGTARLQMTQTIPKNPRRHQGMELHLDPSGVESPATND